MSQGIPGFRTEVKHKIVWRSAGSRYALQRHDGGIKRVRGGIKRVRGGAQLRRTGAELGGEAGAGSRRQAPRGPRAGSVDCFRANFVGVPMKELPSGLAVVECQPASNLGRCDYPSQEQPAELRMTLWPAR